MKIIRHREIASGVSYQRFYEYADHPGSGFGFDCDENGNVHSGKLNPEALENFKKCLLGTAPHGKIFKKYIIQKSEWFYAEPAIGQCRCGAEVELSGFTNTCDRCGADYNSSGQELAPRSQWGDDTGESLADIMNIR
jgi:hypothetical protein